MSEIEILRQPSLRHSGMLLACDQAAIRIAVLTLLFFIASAARSVWSNDTLEALGAGGLVPLKSSEIAIESEVLEVSTHQIKIRYQFRNSSDKDVDAVVGFPLPELDGGAVYNTPMEIPNQGEFNFVDFNVVSDGIVIPVKMESRAFYDGRDITARLQSLGIPATVLPEPLNSALLKLTPEQRQQLEKDEWIVAGDFNPPLRSAGKRGWWATYTMRVQFYWRQHFPSHKSIELVQTYRPIVGGTMFGLDDDVQNELQPFCPDEQTLHQVAAIREQEGHSERASKQGYLKERRLKYILTTAKNWNGPIHEFTLSVLTDDPDGVVTTCMTGLKRISSTRYELKRSGFSPDRELEVLFLERNK